MFITHVISDTHFNHANILKYEPMRLAWGQTPEEMTETMIAAWNSRVSEHDVVLHLGDFAMGKKELHRPIRERLNGKIVFVQGNHDVKPERFLLKGDECMDVLEFKHDSFGTIVCRHDPAFFTQDEADRADFLLHGHLHSGKHRGDTPDVIKHKAACLSVERLPTAPAPMSFVDVFLSPWFLRS